MRCAPASADLSLWLATLGKETPFIRRACLAIFSTFLVSYSRARQRTVKVHIPYPPPKFSSPLASGGSRGHGRLLIYDASADGYKLAVCSRKGVPQFGPPIPNPPTFKHNEYFRDFLLTKRASI